MRVSARRGSQDKRAAGIQEEWIARERKARLFEKSTYDEMSARVENIRLELLALLDTLKSEGKTIAGYGAPAKGNTLLNYFRIGTDRLEFLADKNPLKHGRYSPGMRIPIFSPDKIAETKPDYLLILAWNFAEEIMREQEDFRARGGKFIIPIPAPKVVG